MCFHPLHIVELEFNMIMDSFICYKYIYIGNPISFIHSVFNSLNEYSFTAYSVKVGENINIIKAGSVLWRSSMETPEKKRG